MLVAVRADFYGRCASYPELWRLLGANQVLVGPMRRDELRRAIELPAQRAGLRVEPDLVDALIADVEGEPGALPLLSTALLELWQQRDGRRLRLDAATTRPAACTARSRGWPSAPTSGLTRSNRRSRAGSCCGSRARARATPSCAGACAWPSSTAKRGRGRALRTGRRPAGHDRRGRGRGRARGAAARVAAPARLARGGRRGPPPAPPAARRRARMGRGRPRPGRAVPRRAPGRGARLVGGARGGAERDRARVPGRRAERRASAPSAACAPCSRASPRCSCSR